jgi:hypothetical protein
VKTNPIHCSGYEVALEVLAITKDDAHFQEFCRLGRSSCNGKECPLGEVSSVISCQTCPTIPFSSAQAMDGSVTECILLVCGLAFVANMNRNIIEATEFFGCSVTKDLRELV